MKAARRFGVLSLYLNSAISLICLVYGGGGTLSVTQKGGERHGSNTPWTRLCYPVIQPKMFSSTALLSPVMF